MSVVRLVSGRGLENQRSVPSYKPLMLGNDFGFFLASVILFLEYLSVDVIILLGATFDNTFCNVSDVSFIKVGDSSKYDSCHQLLVGFLPIKI